ncbi:MAG: phage shock protein A [Spirochaetia bacterium]|nr:phage shock protein A [Spirochaetia bacterium]
MSVFSRFMDIVNSNINSILDKAEDPEKMIKLMIMEMEDTLIELKTSCASSIASEKKAEKKINEIESAISRWQSRAMLAIEKHREDLAKDALLEKKKLTASLEKEKQELNSIKEIVRVSKDEISQVEDKLRSVNNKYTLMKERTKRAEEEKKAQDILNKTNNTNFDFMEDRINRMEAMNDLDSVYDDLDKKFKDLEGMDDIDKELAELRKKLEK